MGCLTDFALVPGELNIVAVTEGEIVQVNRRWLNHDYPTDVITFGYGGKRLNADIYVCPAIIIINAKEHSRPFVEELHRCVVHGVLHLAGLDDKTEEGRKRMRIFEDEYLEKLNELFHVKQS